MHLNVRMPFCVEVKSFEMVLQLLALQQLCPLIEKHYIITKKTTLLRNMYAEVINSV